MKICPICADKIDENDEFINMHDDSCYAHKDCSKIGYETAVLNKQMTIKESYCVACNKKGMQREILKEAMEAKYWLLLEQREKELK